MRATAIDVTTLRTAGSDRDPSRVDCALVELRPCLLARLFGARVVVVELERDGQGYWHTAVGDRRLSRGTAHARSWAERYDHLLLEALDLRPPSPPLEERAQAAGHKLADAIARYRT